MPRPTLPCPPNSLSSEPLGLQLRELLVRHELQRELEEELVQQPSMHGYTDHVLLRETMHNVRMCKFLQALVLQLPPLAGLN